MQASKTVVIRPPEALAIGSPIHKMTTHAGTRECVDRASRNTLARLFQSDLSIHLAKPIPFTDQNKNRTVCVKFNLLVLFESNYSPTICVTLPNHFVRGFFPLPHLCSLFPLPMLPREELTLDRPNRSPLAYRL